VAESAGTSHNNIKALSRRPDLIYARPSHIQYTIPLFIQGVSLPCRDRRDEFDQSYRYHSGSPLRMGDQTAPEVQPGAPPPAYGQSYAGSSLPAHTPSVNASNGIPMQPIPTCTPFSPHIPAQVGIVGSFPYQQTQQPSAGQATYVLGADGKFVQTSQQQPTYVVGPDGTVTQVQHQQQQQQLPTLVMGNNSPFVQAQQQLQQPTYIIGPNGTLLPAQPISPQPIIVMSPPPNADKPTPIVINNNNNNQQQQRGSQLDGFAAGCCGACTACLLCTVM